MLRLQWEDEMKKPHDLIDNDDFSLVLDDNEILICHDTLFRDKLCDVMWTVNLEEAKLVRDKLTEFIDYLEDDK